MRFRTRPIGAILAGGGGRRIGGDKAIVELQGRPLISYPLEAVREALGQVAILAKADTKLPYVSGVTVWIEPEPRAHPLIGITQALALADGRPVLVCGADLPFVSARLIRKLARTNPGRAP
ncbi:MAG TPA: NTP transferase domain-containing protein, partial [Solirubrobacteraceae bacterium]|nr:NTP transferase domain-containing protein [Solirubrobacteraceae bacterium]